MTTASPSRFHAAYSEASAFPSPLPKRPKTMPADSSARCLRSQLPPPHPELRSSVIIPAKDEADSLPETLAALAAQTDLAGQPLPVGSFEVIVLANNCTDATADVVRQQARRFPHLAVHVAELKLSAPQAHVGRARRLLMDEAAHRLETVGQPTGLIISTDADTCVAPDWLAATWAEIAAGADAVGGRILTLGGPAGPCPVRRTQLRDAAYHLLCARLESLLDPAPADPWPRHHQHFGASLALTVAAYRRVGGLPEKAFLEDEALWQALRRHDLRLRHSPAVRVFTSDRQQGRVPVGLSWQLREWATLSQQCVEPSVVSPGQLAELWPLRHQLRACWAGRNLVTCHPLAERLGLDAYKLAASIVGCGTFGELWDWVLSERLAQGQQDCQVPLSVALLELRGLLAQHEKRLATT